MEDGETQAREGCGHRTPPGAEEARDQQAKGEEREGANEAGDPEDGRGTAEPVAEGVDRCRADDELRLDGRMSGIADGEERRTGQRESRHGQALRQADGPWLDPDHAGMGGGQRDRGLEIARRVAARQDLLGMGGASPDAEGEARGDQQQGRRLTVVARRQGQSRQSDPERHGQHGRQGKNQPRRPPPEAPEDRGEQTESHHPEAHADDGPHEHSAQAGVLRRHGPTVRCKA